MRRARVSMLMVVIAVIASALPAAAQANDDYWNIGGNKLGGAGAKVNILTGGTASFQVGPILVGPCEILDKDRLWNGATMGEGERTIWGMELPCATSVPNCKVIQANTKGMPWPVTLVKGIVEVTSEVDLVFENSPACKGAGVGGLTVPIKGVMKGPFNNSTSCIDSNKESGLMAGMLSIPFSGEDCYTVEEGEEGEGEPVTVGE